MYCMYSELQYAGKTLQLKANDFACFTLDQQTGERAGLPCDLPARDFNCCFPNMCSRAGVACVRPLQRAILSFFLTGIDGWYCLVYCRLTSDGAGLCVYERVYAKQVGNDGRVVRDPTEPSCAMARSTSMQRSKLQPVDSLRAGMHSMQPTKPSAIEATSLTSTQLTTGTTISTPDVLLLLCITVPPGQAKVPVWHYR